jgi:protoporphyrinogen oxidase
VERLRRRGDSVEAVEGTCMTGKFDLPCDVLISTIPLQMLSRLVFEDKSAVHMADDLEFRHLIMVYLFIDKPLVLKDQWIFFPERKYLFSRIFEQKQILETLGPKNKTAICCDLTCPEESWAWKADDKALLDRCAQGLQDAGFVSEKKSIYSGKVLRVKNFYPRYGADYSQRITSMTAQLQKVNNLLLTGRLGMYNYNNSDHCFDMGRFIADGLAGGESAGKIWNDLAARVAEYRIVD